jgi:hypothetical protein
VVIGVAVASVIAVALLLRPAVGAAWAAALVGFAAGYGWRSIRRKAADGLSVARGGDGRRRILVLADATVGAEAMVDEILERSGGAEGEVFVVVPGPAASASSSSQPEAAELARQRLELALQAIQEAGLRARGRLGDSEPGAALTEALREFGADEIVIVERR